MKLTQGQLEDLESIKYFLYAGIEKNSITEKDIQMFFEYSEKGRHKEKIRDKNPDGFNTLCQGKRWRGIHIHEMYEPGILEGTMPYWVILGGLSPKEIPPKSVVNILAKEMFKGADKDIIHRVYQEVLDYWTWWRKLIFYLNSI